MISPAPDIISVYSAANVGWKRTSRLFGLGEQTLLERPLLLQCMQALVGIWVPQVRPALWRVIFGKDAMPICIEDDERIDGVQCQIHHIGCHARALCF
jgi:hypothetical protein